MCYDKRKYFFKTNTKTFHKTFKNQVEFMQINCR